MLPSRELPARRLLVAGAAVVLLAVVVAGAVALGVVGGQETVLDQVPDDADGVVRIDPAILDDPASRPLLASGLAAAGVGSTSVEDAISGVESRTGLSLDDAETVVAFGRYGATGSLDVRYVGVVVHADWEPTAVRDALERTMGIDYAERTYGGHTVYQADADGFAVAPSVAVLDEGEYVIGTPLTVEDAIAVANGNADALGGPVRASLSATDGGLITAATTLPRQRVADFDARTGGLTRLDSIRVVAGTYDASEDGISLTVRLRTNGTEAARDVTDVARGGVAIVASDVENETVADTIRSIEVDRQGQDVRLSLETTAAKLRAIARYYGLVGA